MSSQLPAYKREFIEFMVRAGVLTFGDFITKSGRKTPYFINTGRYKTGAQMRALGRYYADAILQRLGDNFDVLYGPAYKGIPLVVAVAIDLAGRGGREIPFCFNRKEAKDHGEGGTIIGHAPRDGERVLVIEDVTTAGTSVRESVAILGAAAHVKLAGLVVSVDRRERGAGAATALEELSTSYAMPTFAIVDIDEIMSYLRGRTVDGRVVIDDAAHARLAAYRAEYGPLATR